MPGAPTTAATPKAAAPTSAAPGKAPVRTGTATAALPGGTTGGALARGGARATLALLVPALALAATAPAHAHGAPTDPVSRTVACSPDGGARAGSAACRAAVAANGGPIAAWDNLRLPDVGARDRQTVPDGRLCSAGLPGYRGLDLARTDWPATRLTPGGTITVSYASTIPHAGSFKFFLTKPGYDPTRPLAWSDLPERPFAEVRDPALTGGAYRMRATLPSDRTGRHVLYTVWRNSSTPDTYYSCSDVEFASAAKPARPTPTAAAEGASEAGSGKNQAGAATRTPEAAEPSAARTPATVEESSGTVKDPADVSTRLPVDATPVAQAESGPSAPWMAGGAAGVLLLTGGITLALRLRRRA
ncbi:lytic polysaccharide monooxygenase [Streptomyces sp. NPDC058739]|uniref:lytic polysaccharide monooxygenase n=1 Tax=Streptomyces sp. NPDC058739 TaxID=3346618 RepID=UPI0036AABC38